MRKAALFLVGLLSVSLTWAGAEPDTYDRINLSVNAEKQVANDTVFAELYSEREGGVAAQVAADVNRDIAWALERAESDTKVSAQTTGYFSQPVYREQTVVGWRVRQSIRLKSGDATALGGLIGELQQKLAMASITYAISSDLRARAEDDLIKQALDAFGERARLVTIQLGRSDYRIVRLDVSTSGAPAHPVRMESMAYSMRAAADVAPPAIESGEQTVHVDVTGTIELKPE